MKSFEKEIKKRVLIQTIKAIIIGVFVIVMSIIKVRLHGAIESVSNVDRYILIGMFCGGEVSAISMILKYRKALKTPETLEELHIREKDERNRIITLKTCQSTVNLICALLGIAGVIASFFNYTVLLTIGVILIVILALSIILKLYYLRKY